MSRSAGLLLHVVKTSFEHSVNMVLDLVAPPRQAKAVPVLALVDREWQREAMRRRRISAR